MGCNDKVLSLKWHPFFDYILASGSADNIVRVWDTKNVSLIFSFRKRMGTRSLSSTKLEYAVCTGTMKSLGFSSLEVMIHKLLSGTSEKTNCFLTPLSLASPLPLSLPTLRSLSP